MNPIILPKDMTKDGLKERLERVKTYRDWAVEQKLRRHIVTETEVKGWLDRSGYDSKLSKIVFAD